MKYSFSIGCMFKNEAPYLEEWIEHYLKRNTDHFYFINDQSDDKYQHILNKYKKYITVFNVDEDLFFTGRQMYFYNKFFKGILKDTEWIGVFDIDEYVWSPHSCDFKKCLNFLKINHIDYYRIPMILFGSNKYRNQPQEIVNSFTRRVNFDKDYLKFIHKWWQYKNIARADKITNFRIHDFDTVQPCKKISQNNLNINANLFRLNHYRLQSEEKWRASLIKTDINSYIPPDPDNFSPGLKSGINNNSRLNYRTMELFYQSDLVQNAVEDYNLVDQNRCNNILYEPK